ncbi:MAG: FAD-binding protein [Elusimicrobia bacterium]|nr:MAG: FAD-binding protein [Elusimicrobiota bacterium]
MVWQSQSFVGKRRLQTVLRTWNGDVCFVAKELWEPAHSEEAGTSSGLSDLVTAIVSAATANQRLMTAGSAWSFENLIQSDGWVLSLKNLNRRLHYVTDGDAPALSETWRQRQTAAHSKRRLVHVEAGITLGALSQLLQANRNEAWSLPTLGGTNGQTLAGAIATSTHGGECEQAPLSDLVRAIHLVTDGGRQVWIEPRSEAVTDDARLRAVLPYEDTEIIRSDELFNAAVVSMGRFGVIYSVVLEVTQAFNVIEVVTAVATADVLQALADGVSTSEPLAPLLSLLAKLPYPQKPNVQSEAVGGVYSCQLVCASRNTRRCWATRRWVTRENAIPLNTPTDPRAVHVLVARAARGLARVGAALGVPVGPSLCRVLSLGFDRQTQEGRRGPFHLLASGTAGASQHIPYVVDAIEIIFPVRAPQLARFLDVVFTAAEYYEQAGFIAIRPSRASSSTLSMHNVDDSHAYAIEFATLKHMHGSKKWLQFIHQQALLHGGRPHWGLYNKLTPEDVYRLYGEKCHRWHRALWSLTRDSMRFSSDFTRQRGLDPSSLRLIMAARRNSAGEITHLAGGPDAAWSPISVRDAIADIRSGTQSYAIASGADLSFIVETEGTRGSEGELSAVPSHAPADRLLAALPTMP